MAIKSTSIQGLVDYWIRYPEHPGRDAADALKGQDAQDVAAYVGAVAAGRASTPARWPSAGGVTGTTPAAGKAVFHRRRRVRQLPHAGGRRHHRDRRAQPRYAACARTAPPPQSKKIRGVTLQKCIETAITKPYAYIPAGYHAGVMPANFATDAEPNEITALVNFLAADTK